MMDDIYYSKCLFFVQPGYYLHNSLGLFAEPCPQKLLSFRFHPKKFANTTREDYLSGKKLALSRAQLPGAYLINWIIRPTKCSFDQFTQALPISKCEWNLFGEQMRKISSFSPPILFLIPNDTKLNWIICKNSFEEGRSSWGKKKYLNEKENNCASFPKRGSLQNSENDERKGRSVNWQCLDSGDQVRPQNPPQHSTRDFLVLQTPAEHFYICHRVLYALASINRSYLLYPGPPFLHISCLTPLWNSSNSWKKENSAISLLDCGLVYANRSRMEEKKRKRDVNRDLFFDLTNYIVHRDTSCTPCWTIDFSFEKNEFTLFPLTFKK